MSEEAIEEEKYLSILYVGNDHAYWNAIKTRYQNTYNDVGMDFSEISQEEKISLNKLYVNILNKNADIIYIDFAQFHSNMMYLVHLIKNEPRCEKKVLVALLDYLTPIEIKREVISAGLALCHVKSTGEMHDAVYDAVYFRQMSWAKEPDFANARLDDSIVLAEYCRLHYIGPKSVRIEGNFQLEEGREIKLKTCLYKKVVPSLFYKVVEFGQGQLVYDFDYYAILEYMFADPIAGGTNVDSDNEDQVDAIQKRSEAIKAAKKSLKVWMMNEFVGHAPDQIKVLIIDHHLLFLKEMEKNIDQIGYIVKCKTYLENTEREIDSYMPHCIFFQYEEPPKKEEEEIEEDDDEVTDVDVLSDGVTYKNEKEIALQEEIEQNLNDFRELSLLVQTIKNQSNYNPVLVVFNYKGSSESLQKELDYKQIIVQSKSFHTNTVKDIITLFDKKHKKNFKPPEDNRVILKTTDFTRTESKIFRSAKLMCASESVLFLESDQSLSFYSVHEITVESLGMFITIVPMKESERKENVKNYYKGLIHAINEQDKKELRRFINSVFFRKLEEEKAEDAKKFKDLNENAYKKKNDDGDDGNEI